jgi:hypothetical protein
MTIAMNLWDAAQFCRYAGDMEIPPDAGRRAASPAPEPQAPRYFETEASRPPDVMKILATGLPALLHAIFWIGFVLVMIPHLPPTDLYPAPPVEALGRINFSHKDYQRAVPAGPAQKSPCCAPGRR